MAPFQGLAPEAQVTLIVCGFVLAYTAMRSPEARRQLSELVKWLRRKP